MQAPFQDKLKLATILIHSLGFPRVGSVLMKHPFSALVGGNASVRETAGISGPADLHESDPWYGVGNLVHSALDWQTTEHPNLVLWVVL